jgi:hypothetical protein
MRILQISAETDKALEPRQNGQTVFNHQQLRYLAIISRRLAPLNEKWGKSSREKKTCKLANLKTCQPENCEGRKSIVQLAS